MRLTTLGLTIITTALAGCAQDGTQIDDTSEASEAEKLVFFEMSNGNRLTMTGLPDGEIILMETTPAGNNERFVVDDFPGASPLELFVRLTPEGTAVPARIAASATDEERAAWMSQRQIANAEAPILRLDVADLGWQPIANATPGLGSCNPDTGAAFFEDNHCGQWGPYGYGVHVDRCDDGKAFNYWQRTEDNMRHQYTRTAACDGTGRIRHSRYYNGWDTIIDETIEPNTVAVYYSYKKSGVKHDRRARSEPWDPYDSDAYVRQWVIFFDQVVSNAP